MAASGAGGKPLTEGAYGWGENSTRKRWDAAAKTWTYEFPWGKITARYAQVGEQMDVEVRVENRADSGIDFEGASVYPLTVHLPERPAGFAADTARLTDNLEEPGVVAAEYGTGTLAVVVPDDGKPLFSGLEPIKSADNVGSVYAVMAGGVKPDSLPEAKTLRPAVHPGESDWYTVSIRFASAGQGAAEVAQDAYRNWSKHWPRTLNWKDRRVIGTVYLASSPGGVTDFAELGSNPRRYFTGQAGGDVNVKSAEGLAAFQQRVLRQALAAAGNLRKLDAQGVITWDLEGEEFPQNTSYVCAPEQVATVAPEMETVIADAGSPYGGMKLDDAYFKILRESGFRVGVCVRPQRFEKDAQGRGRQVMLENDAAAAELVKKVRYAHERWGATLFYVDSTVDGGGRALPAWVLERAAAAVPDGLLIPEESTLRLARATAPFASFLFHGDTGTAARVRAVYPEAFSANLVNDVDSAKLAEHRDELVDAVRHGDVLMVHADYWQSNNDTVAAIYREAAEKKQ